MSCDVLDTPYHINDGGMPPLQGTPSHHQRSFPELHNLRIIRHRQGEGPTVRPVTVTFYLFSSVIFIPHIIYTRDKLRTYCHRDCGHGPWPDFGSCHVTLFFRVIPVYECSTG